MTDPAPPSSNPPSSNPPAQPPKTPQFPPHNAPRVWLLTNGASPISINLARHLLAHGDYVVSCVCPRAIEHDERHGLQLAAFYEEIRRQGSGKSSAREKDKESSEEHLPDVGKSEGEKDGSGEDKGDSHGEKGGSGRQNGTGKSSANTKMKPYRERMRVVPLDSSSVSQAQAAVAEALAAFGMGIDILLLSTPSAVLGTVEELSQTPATTTLVRDQFETNFFGNVNLIKAVLPAMRERKNGHIVLLSGVSGHLGTPGLATHCASQWAIEGYCDSLAYEIAPFNVKMTVVQPNMEIGILTNRIISVPPMAEYAPDANPAPFAREIFAGLLDKLEGAVMPDEEVGEDGKRRSKSFSQLSAASGAVGWSGVEGMMDVDQTPGSAKTVSDEVFDMGSGLTTGDLLSSPSITGLYAPLSPAMQTNLVAETVFAIAAIGGHDNPPARHIVGVEGVASVKEKLKTVSEELEDFIEVSSAVDFAKEDGEGMIIAAG